jgi:AraC-like DNA-binding protein
MIDKAWTQVVDLSPSGNAGHVQPLTVTTSDLDQARAVLGRHFYSNFVDVLSPATGWQARFDVMPTGAVTFGDLRFGADVRIDFGELGAYHVDVPLTGQLAWHQGTVQPSVADRTSAAVFQPVGDTVLDRWQADCRLIAVKVERIALENTLAAMLDRPVTSPVRLEPRLDISSGLGSSWLRLVRMIMMDSAQQASLMDHPQIGRRLQESLVTGLLLATNHQYRTQLDSPRQFTAAPRAVRRAAEAMRAEPGRPFTVTGLAEMAGVSRRSLQQGFQRYVGMSPMTYLREVRLGCAHDDLRYGDPADVSVTAVAYRYGFLHMGRFSAMYRHRYGERPSQTLRS